MGPFYKDVEYCRIDVEGVVEESFEELKEHMRYVPVTASGLLAFRETDYTKGNPQRRSLRHQSRHFFPGHLHAGHLRNVCGKVW